MKQTIIIAEVGVNHNGDIQTAFKMIDAAHRAGADYVKFQTFKASLLTTNEAPLASYQESNLQNEETNQYKMLSKLELSDHDFVLIEEHCRSVGIQFLSTPFDIESIRLLEKFDMPFWKVPSGEMTNYPYLVKIAQTGKDVLLSTGMSELEEIDNTVRVLKEHGCGRIKLLHCNTEYPTPYSDVNLGAIGVLQKRYNTEVGYSDHTQGIEVPIAAVAMGATIIEKHFTLSRKMKGPDHIVSLEPHELETMVKMIRNVENAVGKESKMVTESERKNILIARKSIVAKCDIKLGEVFSEENIITKRPGDGISPMKWPYIIGKTANKSYKKDEKIEL